MDFVIYSEYTHNSSLFSLLNKKYKTAQYNMFKKRIFQELYYNTNVKLSFPQLQKCIYYLPSRSQFVGGTGYIDNIKIHHHKSLFHHFTPTSMIGIGIGKDIYKRPYISLYIPNKGVITLFQRFYDCHREWAWASNYAIPHELSLFTNRLDESDWSTFNNYITKHI